MKITTLTNMIEAMGVDIRHFTSATVLFYHDRVSVIYCNNKHVLDLVVSHYETRDNYVEGVTSIPMYTTNDFSQALLSAAEYLIGDNNHEQ